MGGKPVSAVGTWLTGVGLVLFSVVVASGMGIYQEVLFKTFGQQAIDEGIFYSHALPLPGFLFLANDLRHHMKIYSSSDPVKINLEFVDDTIPVMWLLLMANVVTMYGCTSSVFSLIAASSSLTVTLVVTLRKFVSLLLSVFLFQNTFTFFHWVGTILVFGGTVMYTEMRLPKAKIKEKEA
ncbi:hypothetical protein RvY_05405 [Ramazzottius varieornatus]|uniref:Sugar phosphate transporter domain-containing protein n=1 Tax=Ramazzottius varieornatus TaxID=947166 RepID=A0A1D1UXZ5_RAMVA|nr:hypothetical protein RvY_05405 [Ramazzottius varieornatus]